jgi:energy-coupling factor transport system substrate-specific component
VSWQAAILLLLALTVIGGVAWYERSRPPAQVVALVAALAALSIAGRVAFSPIPNVVPTTDITLIAGYALGGPPGFAVGALSALVSNFWLGQGPWTPWQMAAWGGCGLLGAMLAAVTRGQIGRLRLALACGFAGLAFGALMDLSLMVTYGGEQSLDRFLAISARGIPFNLAHAAGNFTLALVAGPALIRMLQRYRSRFEFAWGRGADGSRRAPVAVPAACLLLAISFAGAAIPGSDAKGAGAGSGQSWLAEAQNPDGGFGFAPGEDSNPGMTGWAVLGLEAAGRHPLALRRGANTPISYLRDTVSEITTTGDIERTILVLSAAGIDPRRFEGRDLVARLLARRGGDGSWGRQVNPTAFGVMALAAAGHERGNGRSAAWLRSAANDDGGWGFVPDATSDPDSTGAALQALVAAGGSRGAIAAGVRYLRGAQRPGGGFALLGGPVNAQSTAWAVQGLIAAGVSPRKVRRGGRSPLDYLASVQAGDGHYRYSKSSDQTPVWVSSQALQSLSGQAFPLRRVAAPAPRPAKPAGEPQAGGAGAGVAAAPGGGGQPLAPGAGEDKGKAQGKPAAPAASAEEAAAPPPPAAAEPFEPAADASDPGAGDDSELPTYLAAALVLAVAIGGGWLLRRQSRAVA